MTSPPPPGVRVISDLVYARPDDHPLALDLYRPTSTACPALVVYFHGGGWAAGGRVDRAEQRAGQVAQAGLAVCSVSYRLTDRASYPAQLEDAQTAVRWLRANADELGVDARRIGAWGASAGGYLAAMLALSAECPSEAIQSVVAWFSPFDLAGRIDRTAVETRAAPAPREAALLGKHATDPEYARAASPLHRISAQAPPFLIMHGDHDRLIPSQESVRMHDALVARGVDSTLVLIGGAGHEDVAFERPTSIAMVARFLSATLAHE